MNYKKLVITIPSLDAPDTICDFVLKTAQELGNNNLVFIIDLQDHISIKDLILLRSRKKNYKTLSKNTWYITPIFLIPFFRFDKIRNLNFRVFFFLLQIFFILRYPSLKKILWSFFPQYGFIANYFFAGKLLFDIVDLHSSIDPNLQKKIEEGRKTLLEKSHFITCISLSLKKYLANQTKKKITIVPQGFSLETFKIWNKKIHIIKLFSKKQSKLELQPCIGFIGGINNRLDYSLLVTLAKNNPYWTFIFVGPQNIDHSVQTKDTSDIEKLKRLENVIFHSSISKELIPYVIKQFDICMIPYDISEPFNKFCYPMKLFEYFYFGKPVISTPIEELKQLKNFVKIASTATEWEKEVKTILTNKWSDNLRNQARQLAIRNSWKEKVNRVLLLIKSSEKEDTA